MKTPDWIVVTYNQCFDMRFRTDLFLFPTRFNVENGNCLVKVGKNKPLEFLEDE